MDWLINFGDGNRNGHISFVVMDVDMNISVLLFPGIIGGVKIFGERCLVDKVHYSH